MSVFLVVTRDADHLKPPSGLPILGARGWVNLLRGL